MKYIKSIFIFIIPLLIIFFYLGFINALKDGGLLDEKDFINNITIFVGWLVALLIAFIHLIKTREDNRQAKKEEIKKSLEIEAFREINKAVSNFSSLLTGLSSPYFSLPGKLKMHIENPQFFKFNQIEIDLQLNKQIAELYGGTANFVITIESNEIAVTEFDHYRKYIQHRVDDIYEAIRKFLDYFIKTQVAVLTTQEGYTEFKKRCGDISELFGNIQGHLFDYRIELMNSMLEEIFDKKVPERKPRDPKYKTLKELAIKEKVEKESEERELKALRKE